MGPTAAAAIAASDRKVRAASEDGGTTCRAKGPRIDGWRDWGFREWRVVRYLEAMPVSERP
jgi:hypothetical protein